MDNQERNREALIEHIAEQDRIIRRRNDQISGQVERIEEVKGELAKYRAMHSQQIKTIARLQENPRPLTHDDLSDEAIRRARVAWLENAQNKGIPSAPTIRAMFAAALAEPTRPEGAEEIEVLLFDAGVDENRAEVANYLAARLTDPTSKEG